MLTILHTVLYRWNKKIPKLVEEIKSKYSNMYAYLVSNKLIMTINNDTSTFTLFHTVTNNSSEFYKCANIIYGNRYGPLFHVLGSDTRGNIHL